MSSPLSEDVSSSRIDGDRLFRLCELELGVVQATIARFDGNGLQVKTWCATSWVAVQTFAIKESLSRLSIACVVLVLVFAMIELPYRRFQWRFIRRSAAIESSLRQGTLTGYEYSVHRCAVNHSLRSELAFSLTQAHFYTFYGLLGCLSVASWLAL